MTKGLFIHRADSVYNDRPAEYYQFPKQYWGRASKFVGDWIIYYEPTKSRANPGYKAVARLEKIIPDPTTPTMYLAMMDPRSFLEFEVVVPFKRENGIVETGLLNAEGKISGRAQSAIRPLSDDDFSTIINLGFPDDEILPRDEDGTDYNIDQSVADEPADFVFNQFRNRMDYVSSRKVRSQIFRKNILKAYDSRCALTGFKFINGGGRAEVEAAHIKPVEHDGPDMLGNGLALSGTVHWMFDRGLITLTDDLDIMVSRHVNDVDNIWQLLNNSKKATPPSNSLDRPHPYFLNWHRENCFKA